MKRLVTLAAGAFALAFALAPAAAQGVLKVGDQRGGSRALMEAAGVLADLPYKIEWSEFPAAAPLLEALNAAAIDTGIVGDAPFTFAVASGAPIRAIMATQQDQGGLAILVRPDSPVRTLADLKGKRIGTGRGSVGHQLMLAALEDAGIPKSAVTLSFLLPAEAKAALTSGSLDAWSTWEPYTSQLERSGEARIVRDGQGITPGLGFQVAHLDAIRAKRPLLEDFVRRLAKARVWGTANHASYAETWSKLIGLPKEVPFAWFTRANVRPLPIDAAVVAAEQRTIDLYVRNGLIPKRLEAAEILDPSFNATVVSGSKEAALLPGR
jgi:sulfonate transport system substrate-binding protein